MPATILALADAVVEQLNATAFSQPVAAVRHYQPCFELSEMTELRVSVVPRSVASKALDRSRDGFDYRIDVAIRKKKGTSPPGSPPHSHVGLLRKFILFAYDPTRKSVVIGPTLIRAESL